ncbi:PAS domain-containing protein [Flavobacterium sp.]|uniref:PAS domain-containing protein n=1 Tax=Flavobacterium sp. TaxID=239 RepID=UPI00286B2227|nr:PAS domain-containing protein [Flavobacterium sp.]
MQNEQENYNITPSNSESKLFGLTYRPTPSDRELEWDRTKVLLSKTDSKGNILYANESFIDVCGYDDFELMDKSHNIIRHPDMPKVIFKIMWEKIQTGEGFHVVMKNMSKTGRYYWVVNDLKTAKDNFGVLTFTGQQKSVHPDLISKIIEPLYRKLLQIQVASGVQSSENYLIGFLEERNMTYTQFIDQLIFTGVDTIQEKDDTIKVSIPKKKGFFSGFFADEKPTAKKK